MSINLSNVPFVTSGRSLLTASLTIAPSCGLDLLVVNLFVVVGHFKKLLLLLLLGTFFAG